MMSGTLIQPKVVRVNWPRILADLHDAGCSRYEVTKLLNVEWSTVQRWNMTIGDIGHGYGKALLELHTARCGEATTLQRLTEAEALA